jgi:N-acetylglucosamine kinase-like BadF-type ATPase
MRLFLGVDGGQSGTTALAADETGRVVGVGRAGPCNHAGAAEGRERFVKAIGGSVREAGGDAVFECACFGFSGGSSDKEALTREIVRANRYVITHDALIALAGATGGKPGVVVIAGTGSMAFGRNQEGRTARAGGWGYAFGDEGSAFDLVRQALRAVLRREEGWGPLTQLREAFLESEGARDAHDLMHRFYTDEYSRARVASLAPLVDDAARAGDAQAREILGGAAHSLATIAAAVRGQLFGSGEEVHVSYTGGVFRSTVVLERFRMLVELTEGNRVEAPEYGPAAGALIEAFRAAGVECTLSDVPAEK